MGSNRRARVRAGQWKWIRKAGLLPVLVPLTVLLLFLVISAAAPQLESFRFVIFGDRTGEARPADQQLALTLPVVWPSAWVTASAP